MRATLLPLLLATALAIPSPAENPQERQAPEKRQDFSELLQLASSAAIAIPTDPAVLLSLAPVVGELASILPTAPVLSALETAAPSGFLSRIVHDPSYAASFESAFAAGNSPSWFLALPTDIKQYLHTYNDLGAVATEVGSAEGIIASATRTESLVSETASSAASSLLSSLESAASGKTTTDSATVTGTQTVTNTGTQTVTGVVVNSNPSTVTGQTGVTVTSSVSQTPTLVASTAGAARQTGALAAGVGVAIGVLGFAVVL